MIHFIAMWSGPRNISTAMMRSFENRPDTAVWDEPFYAYYLNRTGLEHPMAPEIIASQDTDDKLVAEKILIPPVTGETIFYQKHMTQHMLAGTALDWIRRVRNVFLIREPRAVVASYAAKRQNVSATDLGFHRQLEIFQLACDLEGRPPAVLDAADILQNPRSMLSQLCGCLDIPFSETMLTWPAGRRASDGVWARHWYGAVETSTGFASSPPKQLRLAPDLENVAELCRPSYEEMSRYRLRP